MEPKPACSWPRVQVTWLHSSVSYRLTTDASLVVSRACAVLHDRPANYGFAASWALLRMEVVAGLRRRRKARPTSSRLASAVAAYVCPVDDQA